MDNKQAFILWGSAGHAKNLAEVISLQEGRVVALFDSYTVPSALKNVPVYYGLSGFAAWVKKQKNISHIAGLVAIGGHRGRERLAKHNLFREHGLQAPIAIHPSAVMSSTATIGSGGQILALANIAADVIIGDACIINHRAAISHECKLGDGVHVAPGATVLGCVHLEDCCFVGAGAVVLPRLTVGKDAIIGAGAVVTRNVPSGAVVVGNPARQVES